MCDMGRVFNFTFHGIGEPPGRVSDAERDVWVSEPLFQKMLDRVAGEEDIRLTFDDGNVSDAEVVVPSLTERGLQATFFVVADRIGRPGYLSATDLREFAALGMTIGSHGLSHRSWRELDDRALSGELAGSRRLIEDAAGVSVTLAACPFGAYDRRVVRHVRDAGYLAAFTSDGRAAHAADWLQPRISLRRWDNETAIDRALAAGGLRAASKRVKGLVKAWR
jgi:peptidoglycan/xylan/chitin deacetylase (PgdA/CDA1 family)